LQPALHAVGSREASPSRAIEKRSRNSGEAFVATRSLYHGDVAIDKQLQGAVENGELRIAFKPVFTAQRERQTRFALIPLWTSPTFGAMEYREIEPVCERIGLQTEFWDFYFTRTCSVLAGWRLRGKKLPKISAAIPRRYLERPELPRVIDRLTGLYALNPSTFLLQLPARTALSRTPIATYNLAALREMGLGLAISGFRDLGLALKLFAALRPQLFLLDRATIHALIWRNVKAVLPQIVRVAEGIGCALAVDGVSTLSECSEMLGAGFTEIAGPFVGEPISARAVEKFYI
jgi:EAL domain-containing protein (putative c-di-GMP-specific phosphodiesterase class I)